MVELVQLAATLQQFCFEREWRFCFIGGLAVQQWSEPRLTNDLDLTLLTEPGDEARCIDELIANFEPRRLDARDFALEHRVLLLRAETGIGIDIALGRLPLEETIVTRAVEAELQPGKKVRICTPEDLIILKAFAGREEDWRDVRMTIVRQGVGGLDWDYILQQLAPLVSIKEDPEILSRLSTLRERAGRA